MTSRPTDAYVPKPVGLDAEFFRLASETGRVHLQSCDDCGSVQHPPRFLCGGCASRRLGWIEAAGLGTVYSWAMSHFTIDKAWDDRLPYAVVVVDTTEGVRLVGSFSGDDHDLEIGQAISIRCEPISEGFAHLWFDPRGSKA